MRFLINRASYFHAFMRFGLNGKVESIQQQYISLILYEFDHIGRHHLNDREWQPLHMLETMLERSFQCLSVAYWPIRLDGKVYFMCLVRKADFNLPSTKRCLMSFLNSIDIRHYRMHLVCLLVFYREKKSRTWQAYIKRWVTLYSRQSGHTQQRYGRTSMERDFHIKACVCHLCITICRKLGLLHNAHTTTKFSQRYDSH